MNPALLIAESDPSRRALLAAAIAGVTDGPVLLRDWLDPWETEGCELVVAGWAEGGGALLARRASRARPAHAPWLLLTHPEPGRAEIAAAAADARAEVIPAEPLDLDALRNRVRWLTLGASALAQPLPEGALADRPALLRRLAA